MWGFIVVLIVFALGVFGASLGARNDERQLVLDKCIAKYDDMPHNKVEPFCKELLEFKK